MITVNRIDITIRNETAEHFEGYLESVTEMRDGLEPSNAELLRMMMAQFDPEGGIY